MNQFNYTGLQDIKESELVTINGGSEVSDWIVRAVGWLVGGALEMRMDNTGQPHWK